MEKITWDMRYGLPNQTYLKFIKINIIKQQSELSLIDPFALDAPSSWTGETYVARPEVEAEIRQLESKFIVGCPGSGKTTLYRRLPELLHGQALIVNLSLMQLEASVEEIDVMKGQTSLLNPRILARFIFKAFWEDLFSQQADRARLWAELRQDRQWLTNFRWFYHRYRPLPLSSKVSEDFLFAAWLDSISPDEAFSSQITSEEELRELVYFVTATDESREYFGLSRPKLYERIQIFIDSERLSPQAIPLLLQDIQKLYDLYQTRIQVKLFLDSTWQSQVEQIACVAQGRIGVYLLPPWTGEALTEILWLRLKPWLPPGTEYDWSELVPHALQLTGKIQLNKIIIDGALRAYQQNDTLDAPVHALRLTRGLMAACAGCWCSQGFSPPFSSEHLNNLIDFYWKNDKEGI